MAKPTRAHRLADLLLADDGPLEDFVLARRPERSWRLIARDLRDRTNVDLTPETLRSWFADREPAEKAS